MRWYSKRVRPAESCDVLVIVNDNMIMDVPYSAKHREFNARDFFDEEDIKEYDFSKSVKAWAFKADFMKTIEVCDEL